MAAFSAAASRAAGDRRCAAESARVRAVNQWCAGAAGRCVPGPSRTRASATTTRTTPPSDTSATARRRRWCGAMLSLRTTRSCSGSPVCSGGLPTSTPRSMVCPASDDGVPGSRAHLSHISAHPYAGPSARPAARPITLPAMHARVWVVIPTYHEAENVEGIVRATVTELERVAPESHHILVVDDNSPDGTGAIADRLAEQHPQVEVLHRATKTGLGHAYLAGF